MVQLIKVFASLSLIFQSEVCREHREAIKVQQYFQSFDLATFLLSWHLGCDVMSQKEANLYDIS